jgi:hypothetical protein
MTQTIGQQINWDFETNGPLIIKDKNGGLIYYEELRYWAKREYDSQGNQIYFEDSNGYWAKRERDSNGRTIYHESSDGIIIDNRPKPLEIEVTTTKTYKVGDSVECLTDDGWMDGGITDIDLSKRVLFVYIEDYDEIRKFTTNQIK